MSGDLKKTKYWAEGTVHFKIDFLNETDKKSADIEAIYFYSTKGWTLKQDGKECPSTDSDLPDFEARHFLTPPVRRLHSGAWAQVKFDAWKVLAWFTKGQELKDSYRINRRGVLRLVTDEGNFDYELEIDVEVDDLPF